MKKKISPLEHAVLTAGKYHTPTPEPRARWKADLMRAIRLSAPQEPMNGLGPLVWKCAGVALAASMVLSIVSSRYGALEDYIMQQSEISETANYVLAQSL